MKGGLHHKQRSKQANLFPPDTSMHNSIDAIVCKKTVFFGLCTSSIFQLNYNVSVLDLLPSSGEKEGQKPLLLGPLVELASDMEVQAQQLGFLFLLFT
jgi:hypothetical protein